VANPLRKDLEAYKFKPGCAPGPGRPVGSRNKLTEAFLEKLNADFQEHGTEVIERVRQRKPEVYLMAVSALVPKKVERVDSPFADISDEELEQLEQHLAAVRAKTVHAIELHALPVAGPRAPRARHRTGTSAVARAQQQAERNVGHQVQRAEAPIGAEPAEGADLTADGVDHASRSKGEVTCCSAEGQRLEPSEG